MNTKINRRVTVLANWSSFWSLRGLARFLQRELKGDALIISIKRQAKNDDYEASDSVLQSGHLLGSNAVQREFHTNSCQVSLR